MPASGHKHKHQLDGFEGEPVESVRSNGKRVFAAGFKSALVRHCRRPGVSVAGAALAHGVNANLLRRWITQAEPIEPAPSTRLVPVDVQVAMIPAPDSFPACRCPPTISTPTPSSDSRIEIAVHGARLELHGDIDPRRLGIVLDVLARHAR